MRFKQTWVAAIALCIAAPAAFGNVITVMPSKDNSLMEDASGNISGGASQQLFLGRLGTNGGTLKRRVAMAFDLSAIPSNAQITQVSLVMTLFKGSGGATPVELHRLTKNWGEGTSSGGPQGGLSTPGSATWIHNFFSTSTWSNPGGDFDTVSSAVQIASDSFSTPTPTWDSSTSGNQQMRNDVQQWVINPTSNFGWLLIGDEVNISTAKEFASRESSFGQPALTVTFNVPEPGALGALGLIAFAALMRHRRGHLR